MEDEETKILQSSKPWWSWSDDSAVQTTGCSNRESGFNSQHPQGYSQSSVIPVPVYPKLTLPSSITVYVVPAYKQAKPHVIKINKTRKKKCSQEEGIVLETHPSVVCCIS
jgi:hypothetical protein